MEGYKDIPGFEGKYICDESANVISLTRKSPINKKPRKNLDGYYGYFLYSEDKKYHWRSAHRLVAAIFIPNIDNKPHVNHIDGNKKNNHVSNLEWCTVSENHKHAYKNGLMSKKGEKHHFRKLSDKDVLEIRNNFSGKHGDQILLAKKYGVCKATVCSILKKNHWKHI